MKPRSGPDATCSGLETAETAMPVGALKCYRLPLGHRGSFFDPAASAPGKAPAAALYGRAKGADRLPPLPNLNISPRSISHRPGLPVALCLACTCRLSKYPTLIAVHRIALNTRVERYDRQMEFSIVADALAPPNARVLADAVQIAFQDLRPLEAPQGVAATVAPSLAQTGRAVVSQARQRRVDSPSSLGDAVDGTVGNVGNVGGGVLGGVARGLLRGAVRQAVACATEAVKRPRTARKPVRVPLLRPDPPVAAKASRAAGKRP